MSAVERVVRELERKRKLVATVTGLENAALRPLPVLRELTDLLPTDAWLTTVSLDQKGVELTGQAAAASALIPLLENSPRLERVEFASPVTRGRDKEQFRIRAAWEAAPVAATVAPPTPAAGSLAPGARPAPIPIVPGARPGGAQRQPPPPAAQVPGQPAPGPTPAPPAQAPLPPAPQLQPIAPPAPVAPGQCSPGSRRRPAGAARAAQARSDPPVIGTLSRRERPIVVVGAAGLAVVVGWIFLVQPLAERNRAAADLVPSRLQVLARRLDLIARKDAIAKDLEATNGEIERLSDRFLTEAAPAVAASELQKLTKEMASQAATEIRSERILPPVERGELLEIPVEIAVSGEIRQLVDLLSRLEGSQKLLTVQDLRVRVVNVSQPKELLATLTVSGFILPGKSKT